ncbi:hypothetical protein EZS27_031694, partial [termite gut metagenome]
TEDIYEILRIGLSALMGEKDDYLEVFLPDMTYSDTPIRRCISEDLADIYQDIKDFVFVFHLELNETMNDALICCKENFELLWGQKLVNTMRALHVCGEKVASLRKTIKSSRNEIPTFAIVGFSNRSINGLINPVKFSRKRKQCSSDATCNRDTLYAFPFVNDGRVSLSMPTAFCDKRQATAFFISVSVCSTCILP